MKIFLGIIGFFGFVAALMATAHFASAPVASTTATPVAAAKMPMRAPAPPTNDAPVGDTAPAEQKPVPLPALFVYRDNKDPKPVALAGARKKPALLHLWATWCGPCRAELPSVLALNKHENVDVIAVTVDDHYEDVIKYFGGKIPPEVVWDKTITLERALGVENIPTTFLVDTRGQVVDRFDGAQAWTNPELLKDLRSELR